MSVKMIDVSSKEKTKREAIAKATILISKKTLKLIKDNKIPKGDVLDVSKIAGILGAKKTVTLLPLCHPVQLSYIDIDFKLKQNSLEIFAKVSGFECTGFEMEALIAVTMSSLNIYDMCKGVEPGIIIKEIKLIKKSGGKSDIWER